MYKLILLVLFSFTVIIYGLILYKRSLYYDDIYEFKEDLKRNFLTIRWSYSPHNDKSSRVAPAMIVVVGLGILVVGLIKIL